MMKKKDMSGYVFSVPPGYFTVLIKSLQVHEYSIRLLEDLKNNTDLCDSDSVRMDGNGGQNQRDQIYYTLKRIIDHSSGHTLRLAKRCWQVWFEEKKTLLSPYGNPQHATSATSFGHVDKNW